jgi:hypothetical protein
MKVSEDWKSDCLRTYGIVLVGEKAHWCPEWDYLTIDETCDEFGACTCFPEESK